MKIYVDVMKRRFHFSVSKIEDRDRGTKGIDINWQLGSLPTEVNKLGLNLNTM